MEKLKDIIEALNEMVGDSTVPRNVKSKLQSTLDALNEDIELSLRVNKALNELDELTDDINIEAYTRTQLWNLVSMLETI